MSPRRPPSTPRATPGRTAPRTQIVRLALAAMLGVAAALLVACGSSAGKLIPVADSGPLQGDFETVVVDAESANGKCSTTEAALAKTEQDFTALPASVDSGLRATLRQGIDNLRARALALCAQPLAQTTPTNTTSQPSTSSSTTTPTTTPSTTTPTTTAPSTTPTTTSPGGGTPAESGEATPGSGGAPGGGAPGGGTGAGEAPSEGDGAGNGLGNGNGHGNGNGGQEGGK
jgi:hypothetical protein